MPKIRYGVTVIYSKLPSSAVLTLLGLTALTCTAAAPIAQAETATAIAYVLPGASAASQLERLRQQAQQAYQSSQFDQSLPIYQRLSSSGNANANDLYWLGESYFQIGQFASAAQAFEDSIKLDASNDLLKVRLAESYLSARQLQQAKAACEKGMNTASDPRVRQQLSVLLKVCLKPMPEVQKGKFASAQGHTER
jgi:tetratricopeptide (TPR) repeat protein